MDPKVQAVLIAEREAGSKAKTLLADLEPYLAALEAELMQIWRETAKTADVREETWHRLKALDMLRADLGRLINGGDFAEKRLAKA